MYRNVGIVVVRSRTLGYLWVGSIISGFSPFLGLVLYRSIRLGLMGLRWGNCRFYELKECVTGYSPLSSKFHDSPCFSFSFLFFAYHLWSHLNTFIFVGGINYSIFFSCLCGAWYYFLSFSRVIVRHFHYLNLLSQYY